MPVGLVPPHHGYISDNQRKRVIDMNAVHDSMARQGLSRPRDGRILAGVCAGLARRFGLDPWIARLLFVAVLFVIPGSQILIYPLLWLLMPSEERTFAPSV